MSLHKEIHFEAEICKHLGAHGWLYAEGDAAKFLAVLADAQAEMAFAVADFARFADNLQPVSQQQRRRIAGAVGFELFDRLHRAGRERRQRYLGVDG